MPSARNSEVAKSTANLILTKTLEEDKYSTLRRSKEKHLFNINNSTIPKYKYSGEKPVGPVQRNPGFAPSTLMGSHREDLNEEIR